MEINRAALIEAFAEESLEQLAQLEEWLLVLEEDPTRPGDLPRLFRQAHTLKGNASVVGFSDVVAAAHVLEDALDRLNRGVLEPSAPLVAVLLETVDGLRQLVAAALAGEETRPGVGRTLAGFLAEADVAAGGATGTSQATAAATAPHGARTLRVPAERLDRMLALLGELAVQRGRLANLLEVGASALPQAKDAFHDQDALFMALQDLLMRVRMVPLGPLFRMQARTVRDLALAHGKQARIVVDDEGVEVDTSTVEGIRDPLVHLIRNAIDHGLEPAHVRTSRGKDPVGTITVRARYESGRVLISLADDGGGLDFGRIREKARERLGSAADALDERGLTELLFQPGFSTSREVTELSGRGLGMDVVRRGIEALRGTLAVESKPGAGTTFWLRLPLTLAIIDGFAVQVGPEVYVLPVESVVECVELPASERTSGRTRGVIDLRGTPLPYVRLSSLFDIDAPRPERESVVVVRHGAQQAGFSVDALLGDGQTVVKPLPRSLPAIRGISGTALRGDGRVALILDVPGLLESAVEGETVDAK